MFEAMARGSSCLSRAPGAREGITAEEKAPGACGCVQDIRDEEYHQRH